MHRHLEASQEFWEAWAVESDAPVNFNYLENEEIEDLWITYCAGGEL